MNWDLALLICSVHCLSGALGLWEGGGGRKQRVPSHPSPPSLQNLPGPLQAPTPFLPPPPKALVVLFTKSWYVPMTCSLSTSHGFYERKMLLQGSLFSQGACGWHVPGLTGLVAFLALHCRHHVMARMHQTLSSGVEFLGNSGPRKVTWRDCFKSC